MAFVTVPFSLPHGQQRVSRGSANLVRMSTGSEGYFRLSRRAVLSTALTASLLQIVPAVSPDPANASVDIDIERFGDKGMHATG